MSKGWGKKREPTNRDASVAFFCCRRTSTVSPVKSVGASFSTPYSSANAARGPPKNTPNEVMRTKTSAVVVIILPILVVDWQELSSMPDAADDNGALKCNDQDCRPWWQDWWTLFLVHEERSGGENDDASCCTRQNKTRAVANRFIALVWWWLYIMATINGLEGPTNQTNMFVSFCRADGINGINGNSRMK